MLKGYLKKNNDNQFVIRHISTSQEPWKIIEFELNPNSLLQDHLTDGSEVYFTVETIAVGENEFNVIDKDVADIMEINQENLIDSIIERFPDDTFLKADGFDDAIIGVEENSGKLIYSMSKCLNILRQDMSEEDALEHFYYNIHGSYVGDQTPIWCFDYFE